MFSSHRSAGILTCLFFSLLTSSIGGAEERAAKKAWTFLVYLNGNNNLEPYGYKNMREMEKVGSSDDVNVVVEFAAMSSDKTKKVYIQKNDSPYGSDPSTFHSPVVEEMDRVDMGSSHSFVDFVIWGMQNYPADNYFVILWNHGSGWDKEENGGILKGVSYDELSGNHISTNQLADALDEILRRTGTRINVLGFDACLMNMYEVADSFSGMVDYLVGSEETIPGEGYPYDGILNAFYSRDLSKKIPRNLVTDVVTEYSKSYANGSHGTQSITVSGIDLSRLELVKRRLNHWTEVIQKEMKRDDLLKAVDKATVYEDPDNRDLGDYVRLVMNQVTNEENSGNRSRSLTRTNDGVIGASNSLIKAINEAVVENSDSDKYAHSTGLSIYLPLGDGGQYSSWTSDPDKHDLYVALKWAKTTEWSGHLDFLFPKTVSGSPTKSK